MPKTDGIDKTETPDAMTLVAQAIAMMAARQTKNDEQAEHVLAGLKDAMNRMAQTQEDGARLVALETKRAHRPSNEQSHKRSPFNLRGYDTPELGCPKLKCPMVIPWPLDADTMTREEIELTNLLEEGTWPVELTDGTMVEMKVYCEYALGTRDLSKLTITHPTAFNQENFKRLPSHVNWMRSMLAAHPAETRAKAKQVMTMQEEKLLIAAHDLSLAE